MENKFALRTTSKMNIITLALSEKNILNEAKNQNPVSQMVGPLYTNTYPVNAMLLSQKALKIYP
jgi:hypothetical protein